MNNQSSHPFLPHTPEETQQMLQKIGVDSVEELFVNIPKEIRDSADSKFNTLPLEENGLSERGVLRKYEKLAQKNASAKSSKNFLGGGAYRHYVPALINQIATRGEFLTSYTPYQPEVSQGHLQALFEYQTLVARLTGQEISNAGMYDGGTALAEAILMGFRLKKGKNIALISKALAPAVRQCVRTHLQYVEGVEVEEIEIDWRSGKTCLSSLKKLTEQYGDKVCSVSLGYPNYFGVVEDLELFREEIGEDVLLISSTSEALALGILQSPGELGTDISVGDMQSFGIALSYGGPWCGFLSCKKAYLRQLPGRICGQAKDSTGKRSFVLTLSTREQFIRREKATSNICTNNNLLALCATIYLSLLGESGVKDLAELNLKRRCYLQKLLAKSGARVCFDSPSFNEFLVDLTETSKKIAPDEEPSAQIVCDYLWENHKIMIGPVLGNEYPEVKNCVLLSVTELNLVSEIEKLGLLL